MTESHIHKANIVLGRLALLEDDIAQRQAFHLLAAGRVSGGADARQFRAQHAPRERTCLSGVRRDVVLEYFELCSNFWPSEKLKDWTALVKGGRTPDFGGNLVY